MRGIIGLLFILYIVGLMGSCTRPSSRTQGRSTYIPSYDQLVNYPTDCSKEQEQLEDLRNIQRVKNFNSDPDQLNEADRSYNGRLKATIWWYSYRCHE